MVIYQQGNYKSKSTLSVMTFTLNKSNCHILTTGGEKKSVFDLFTKKLSLKYTVCSL